MSLTLVLPVVSFGMGLAEDIKHLENATDMRFDDLMAIAIAHFGKPRNSGTSHYVFKTPWSGKPWVNLQRDGKNAKRYQLKQVLNALKRKRGG